MDLLGWQWEYEPLDFDGYIPDFFVNNSFWIEVKAALTLEDLALEAPKVHRALAVQNHRAVIVGGTAILRTDDLQDIMGLLVLDETAETMYVCEHEDCDHEGEPHAGAIQEGYSISAAYRGSEIPYSRYPDTDPRAYDRFEWKHCGRHRIWTGAEDEGDWTLACGCGHKAALIRNTLDLEALWRKASNLTQWHPKTN
jgi:hypothetical protein